MSGALRCDCGDPECPSCGTAQGTRGEPIVSIPPDGPTPPGLTRCAIMEALATEILLAGDGDSVRDAEDRVRWVLAADGYPVDSVVIEFGAGGASILARRGGRVVLAAALDIARGADGRIFRNRP